MKATVENSWNTSCRMEDSEHGTEPGQSSQYGTGIQSCLESFPADILATPLEVQHTARDLHKLLTMQFFLLAFDLLTSFRRPGEEALRGREGRRGEPRGGGEEGRRGGEEGSRGEEER